MRTQDFQGLKIYRMPPEAKRTRKDGTPRVGMRCEGFPNFGIWSVKDAPFVCLEPWMGRCDDCGFTGDLSEKPFINHLKMDEMFETAYTIEIF